MATENKDQFTSRILLEESKGMDKEMRAVMAQNNFSSRKMLEKRNFKVNGNILVYEHLPEHRFTDMSVRETKAGRIKKVSHPIHNKILYGYANNILRRLQFEYRSRVPETVNPKD